MLCFVVKHLEAVEHSRSREKHSTASRIFPYTSFLLYRFMCALQQNRAQSRLLHLFDDKESEMHCRCVAVLNQDH